jgi:hypothetical protein
MNGAQVHLAVNHFPVVGVLIGALVLWIGTLIKTGAVKRTGLAIILFAALAAIPTYFSGEPAAEIIEHRPQVSEAWIESHEEAAETAFALTGLLGLGAAMALASTQIRGLGKLEKPTTRFVVVFSILAFAALARAAHRGGLIRHDELRTEGASPTRTSQPLESEANEDD